MTDKTRNTIVIFPEEQVLDILARVTGTDQVRRDLDLALFDRGLLDSLGLVELILALSDELSIEISPAEIEREQWASPRRIIAYLRERSQA